MNSKLNSDETPE